jgi:hypothetical protein
VLGRVKWKGNLHSLWDDINIWPHLVWISHCEISVGWTQGGPWVG